MSKYSLIFYESVQRGGLSESRAFLTQEVWREDLTSVEKCFSDFSLGHTGGRWLLCLQP